MNSIWSSPYVVGAITGGFAMGTAYTIGSLLGLLTAAGILSIAASWYYTGRKSAFDEQVEVLTDIKSNYEKIAERNKEAQKRIDELEARING